MPYNYNSITKLLIKTCRKSFPVTGVGRSSGVEIRMLLHVSNYNIMEINVLSMCRPCLVRVYHLLLYKAIIKPRKSKLIPIIVFQKINLILVEAAFFDQKIYVHLVPRPSFSRPYQKREEKELGEDEPCQLMSLELYICSCTCN